MTGYHHRREGGFPESTYQSNVNPFSVRSDTIPDLSNYTYAPPGVSNRDNRYSQSRSGSMPLGGVKNADGQGSSVADIEDLPTNYAGDASYADEYIKMNTKKKDGKSQMDRPLANFIVRTRDNFYNGWAFNVYALHEDARIDVTTNPLFVMQSLELLQALSSLIIGGLVMIEQISINTYWFLIATAIIWLIITGLHFAGISRWMCQMAYTHTHNNTIFIPFIFWLFSTLTYMILIGVWLIEKPNSQCCGFEDSQPAKFPAMLGQEYTIYLMIFGFILAVSIFNIVFSAMALVCHYYPEKRYVPPDYYTNVVNQASQWAATTEGEIK